MATTRKRYGFTTRGRNVFEALAELRDPEGHIISPGELFTMQRISDSHDPSWKRPWPICRECRPFQLRPVVS